MKRVLILFLALVLLFSLVGCGLRIEQTASREPEDTSSLVLITDDTPPDTTQPDATAPDATEPDLTEPPAQEPALDENGVYDAKDEVALYIHLYGHLPSNYITKKEAQALGWTGGSLEPYAPGCSIGGTYFGNYEGLLPEAPGRSYTECDIDTMGKSSRGAKRIVFSNDGLIYYTDDHYESFELLYGEAGE